MADKKPYALPDSFQFRAFYAQKRRRSRNSNIPIVVPITKNFINLLGDPPQAYYELATLFEPSGDYKLEFDFVCNNGFGNVTEVILGYSINSSTFIGTLSSGDIRYRCKYNTISIAIPAEFVGSTKLMTWKSESISNVVSLYLNNTFITSFTQTQLPQIDNFGAYSSGLTGAYFEGIISNVKLTDLTTPANSLSFGLDNLTGDTEVNNGVTLNYRNIALTSDVRDTYTLSNNDTQWISDLRTIDIAEQA